MRIFDRRVLLMLAVVLPTACHKKSQSAEQLVAAAQADDRVIICRIADAAQFAPDCLVERRRGDDGNVLVLRHRDGGFRRIRVSLDGRRINQADGAEQMRMIGSTGNGVEIAIGADHYRIGAHQLKVR
ncbi:MAG: hypothetical protein ABI395_13105 [Sphingobium sp.]